MDAQRDKTNMVDLSKHLTRARQAIDKRSYDLALEIMGECQELDPRNLEVYQVTIDAAKRKWKEKGGKSGMFGSLKMPTMSSDPQKQLSGAVKFMAKSPDLKNFAAAGDAAYKLVQGGQKQMVDVAILLYEEARATGLFNETVLFNLANLYFDHFRETKNPDSLNAALRTIGELERAKPDHATASKLARDWEAARSMVVRVDKQTGAKDDFRSQVHSTDQARKQEVMNRMIRTWEDAQEVIAFIEADLAANPADKHLWVKKGDIHRRFQQYPEAKNAYTHAEKVDQHDFTVTMRLGDVRMEEAKAAVVLAEKNGGDVAAAKLQLQQVQIEEFRTRVGRQPTEMEHRYNLGKCLIAAGEIEAAAGEFQKTVHDPRHKKESLRYLGFCFQKKGLIDLAVQQYDQFLKIVEDKTGDQFKEVLYLRARTFEGASRTDKAIQDYTSLVQMDLGYKDAANRLAALQA